MNPIDPSTWQPPEPPATAGKGRIRGTLHGSRLLEQPRHAALAASARAFCAPWPEQRWLGVELRRTIRDAAEQAPDNCLLLRMDVRVLLAADIIGEGRLSRVDILFPSPSDDPRHLLLTPEIIELLAGSMAADGVLLLATDVPGMAELAGRLLAGWPQAEEPPSGPVRSRREKVCQREGLPVWRFACHPPR
jgi:tRNA G46 methylase TrmB